MSRPFAHRFMLPAGVLALTWLAPLGLAQNEPSADPDPRLDAQTGALKANWPPATPWDHLHMLLEVDFGDLSKAEFRGVQTLTLTPRGNPRGEVVLDCGPDIAISALVIPRDPKDPARGPDGKPLPDTALQFTQKDGKLTIALPEEFTPGRVLTLKTTYTCDFSKNRNAGLNWVKPREDAESETDRFPVVYSQGQSEDNHRWFPCHDFPNERLTTEIIATVPRGYEACSNGRLLKKTAAGKSTVFHWLQDKHHVNYLVTLVVGKYSILNLDPERPDAKPDMSWRRDPKFRLPITAYVPIGKEDAARKGLANTSRMIRTFEELFDTPYPWDKYTQVLVRGFPGGMENTSATTLGASLIISSRDPDDLVSHELAHQWFGDLVTCRGWEHIWLNEGWASYCEALWDENRNGVGTPDDEAYLKKIAGFVSAQRGMNRSSLPRGIPMVSNRYRDPEFPFSKPDNPYSKGAVILHMLRERVGSKAFFTGVHRYLAGAREVGLVDTDMFRRALEEESGENLDQFFEQWCKRPGFPRLDLSLTYDAAAGTVTVQADQTQPVDAENPAYVIDVPVLIKFDGKPARTERFRMSEKTARAVYKVDAKPSDLTFDPRITCLAVYKVTKGLDDPKPEAEKKD